MRPGLPRRDGLILLALWCCGALLDGLWLSQHQLPPAWDQGDHLSRAFGFWRVVQHLQPWLGDWWQELWAQAPSYRGPLTYLIGAPVFAVLGPSYTTAILSNSLFQALLLLSLYGQGRLLGRPAAGLWAGALSAMAPALLNQRTDYLIDFSLTAVLAASWTLLSWRRLGRPQRPLLASAACGLGLGAVLLTRPTGLLLLWLPLLALLWQALAQLRRGRWRTLAEGLLTTALAWGVAGGWVSQNWLTILSTVNNARRWGVLYQEGLEANTLDGWLYYPRLLPAMAGAWLVAALMAGWLLQLWRRGRLPTLPAEAAVRWRLAWWLSFPFGALLLATLMSTKEFRFVLPLLPQLLLLLGLVLADGSRWLQTMAVILGISGLLACQFGWGPNLTGFPTHTPRRGEQWPLAEIVATIRQHSPQQLSTLAVLPDSEFLNAFNLEAEGRRQAFRVAARQTVAGLEQLDEDLAGFDWFLLKSGDQGVMSDERQARLSTMVRQSPDFGRVAAWPLPDGSGAELYGRQPLSLAVHEAPCPTGGALELEVWPASGRSRLIGPGTQLAAASLLMEGAQDHAVGQGMVRPNGQARCLAVIEPLQGTPSQARLLLTDGRLQALPIRRRSGAAPGSTHADGSSGHSAMANRHSQLLELGALLRRGELDELFARVGRINQHDPEQRYLVDGEAILQTRLREDPGNLNLLYPLALAQALQRDAPAAARTLSRISQLDPGNAPAHLGLGFVQLYRFRPWAAEPALQQAARLDPRNTTLRTLRAVAAAMRLDLAKAHSLIAR
jgi:4-amino-4-deoxy-L-arabinose transferase-like glycosyltransferase